MVWYWRRARRVEHRLRSASQICTEHGEAMRGAVGRPTTSGAGSPEWGITEPCNELRGVAWATTESAASWKMMSRATSEDGSLVEV
ncbi:hypothetical protein GUJ93_ZPchr0014g47564 [Zizania palustris]|uniref:Uncharacterized protein n=1 Tax=Zizania palustris TaxID=103762 RepID=A0A8J5W5K6_ZIZPA|nr:hypothetical protein GUJ93_ZPchr0014g47564 [Zizania palustris]